jgi:hypothetical protein
VDLLNGAEVDVMSGQDSEGDTDEVVAAFSPVVSACDSVAESAVLG